MRIAAQQLQGHRTALGEPDRADDGAVLRGDPLLDGRGRGLDRLGPIRVQGHVEPGIALHIPEDPAHGDVLEDGREEGHEAREVALVAAEPVHQQHDRRVLHASAHHGALVEVRGDQFHGAVLGRGRHGTRLSTRRRRGREEPPGRGALVGGTSSDPWGSRQLGGIRCASG